MDWLTIAFLILGGLLIVSEAVHLSLVPVFLGTAALLVGGARAIGLVDSVSASLLLWAVASLGLTLPLRPLARRWLGKGDAVVDRADPMRDAMGTVVDVVEDITDDNDDGRVRHEGTTWNARAVDGSIKKGERARLVYRDKMVWVVEPLDALAEAPTRVPALEPARKEK